MTESHSRSVVKGISWRAVGTLDTTFISYLITGNPLKALSIGGIEVFTKIFLYYFHERIWQKINWGKPKLAMTASESSTKSIAKTSTNIHPVFDRLLSREERESFLNQKGKVIWMTGLSGSGKSTIAVQLERRLFENGFFAQVLDGDNIRSGINNNLGFSLEDRTENIRRISEVAKLYLNSGIITICTFVSPTEEIRSYAKSIIGAENFFEVFVNASLEVCEKRDVKGLYKKARKGEIPDFTGISSPFEPPVAPDLILDSGNETIDTCVEKAYNKIQSLVKS
ncbi:MAG: adenylyl-sulfate kinase [Bacteroidetes bacterium]|nr:adenylyl-sulfate kinase [Bacteroidota bacterium]